MKTIQIREYGTFVVGEKNGSNIGGNITLTKRTFEQLENFILSNSSRETDALELMGLSARRGVGKIITAKNYVGIITMNDGTTIEILPKVYSAIDDDANASRTKKLLINMLKTLRDSPYLTEKLGLEAFRDLFPVILTDNGVEFKDPDQLEHAPNNCPRTKIFYCDPQASWQKPHVEKNHVLLRRILPKGTSFKDLTKAQVALATSHINSVARELFDNQTPFDLFVGENEKKLLELLDLAPIAPDEVFLKPALLKTKPN